MSKADAHLAIAEFPFVWDRRCWRVERFRTGRTVRKRGKAGRRLMPGTEGVTQILQEDDMDDKAITAVSTSLALMQIQLNALVLLLEQQSGVSVKEDFQRLISEGVQAVGLETMQGIRSRIYEGITQQGQGDAGNGLH
jgi:hypothetical protein